MSCSRVGSNIDTPNYKTSDACMKPSQSESLGSSAVQPIAVGIPASIQQLPSICGRDEIVSFQSKTYFWHSRLPRTSLLTSPSPIVIVFSPTAKRGGKNHTNHFGIFGFHPYIVPTHFLLMDTPTASALLSRVVGSIFGTAGPPVLFVYEGFLWLAECWNTHARGTF